MHPVIRPSVPFAQIVARAEAALYPDMVIPIALCLVVAAIFVSPVSAAGVAAALEQFGLVGNWADDCSKTQGNARQGFRIIIAEQPGDGPTYTTINVDNGVKTTVRSLVLTTVPLSSRSLRLRMRIVGGDVDGGPLPSPTTNTFEQTFERGADDTIQMAGNPPVLLQRCRD
jgi:hypothetical protein